MRLYAYCLTDKLAPPSPPELTGIGGQKIFLVPIGSVSAVVSEFEGDELPLTVENIRVHEQVIESVLGRATLLPFRFGTLVSEQKLAQYCERHQSAIESALARVRGCVEMNIKVIAPVPSQAPEGGGSSAEGEEKAEARGTGPGARFLLERADELKQEEWGRKRAEAIASTIDRKLQGSIRETRVSHRFGRQIFLALAHLVEREQLEHYQAMVRELRSEERELHFLTSGPWPPYTFTPAPENGKVRE